MIQIQILLIALSIVSLAQSQPLDRFAVSVSQTAGPDRAMITLTDDPFNADSWYPKLAFLAFHQAGVPGTVQYLVGEAPDSPAAWGPHRSIIVQGNNWDVLTTEGWAPRLSFWAYPTKQAAIDHLGPTVGVVRYNVAEAPVDKSHSGPSSPHRIMVEQGDDFTLLEQDDWSARLSFYAFPSQQ